MEDEILITRKNHLGILTLNRSQALNALSLGMIRIIQNQLNDWSKDSSIFAVIIKSSNEKAFCVGGDVRWLYEAGKRQDKEQINFFIEEYCLNKTIYTYPKPYIALMNGFTMGGGVGISLHGSHAIAGSDFIFAMPETSIGLFPDVGAGFLLSKCPGSLGLYIALTGNRLNAIHANAAQLVRYIAPTDAFSEIIEELAETNLSNDPFKVVDQCLQRFLTQPQQKSLEPLLTDINSSFKQKNIVDILNTLEAGETKWHKETLQSLRSKSPLSLSVTFEQIEKAKHLDFNGCLAMDFRLVQHFIHDHDFYEGVRALLIDKDKSPQWVPAELLDIDKNLLENYFL